MRMSISRNIVVTSVLLIFIIGFSLSQSVYAENLTVSTDKTFYDDGEEINISGIADPNMVEEIFLAGISEPKLILLPVTIQVISSGENLVAMVQIDVEQDGGFSHTIITGGSSWQDPGLYTIMVSQGKNMVETQFWFKFNGGPIPEPDSIPDEINVDVKTSKSEYREGDLIKILGEVSFVLKDIPITIQILDPNGNMVFIDQTEISDNSSFTSTTETNPHTGFKNEGMYLVKVNYDDFTAETSFEFKKESIPEPEPPPPGDDTIPPELLMPADMIITGNDLDGIEITYSVKAIDNFDQILNPKCDPPSGSIFPLEVTIVRCSVTDSSGNTDTDSFKVLVKFSEFVVPEWIKDVAGFWCNDEIDDAAFVQAIQYLITSEVLIVPSTESEEDGSEKSNEIPTWIKNNACWWSQGAITNGDFVQGIEFLVNNGIIKV